MNLLQTRRLRSGQHLDGPLDIRTRRSIIKICNTFAETNSGHRTDDRVSSISGCCMTTPVFLQSAPDLRPLPPKSLFHRVPPGLDGTHHFSEPPPLACQRHEADESDHDRNLARPLPCRRHPLDCARDPSRPVSSTMTNATNVRTMSGDVKCRLRVFVRRNRHDTHRSAPTCNDPARGASPIPATASRVSAMRRGMSSSARSSLPGSLGGLSSTPSLAPARSVDTGNRAPSRASPASLPEDGTGSHRAVPQGPRHGGGDATAAVRPPARCCYIPLAGPPFTHG